QVALHFFAIADLVHFLSFFEHQLLPFLSVQSAAGSGGGAGGDGGSLTLLLGADSSQKRSLIEEIESANPLFQNIPLYLSRFGLRVWETA
ncbi:MAG: hypothetical protein VXW00_05700, partial [Candidatus Latescibacterota bacterium]|nr:hypothetical protein [Candidatus Latescibacterota bacterium]